MAIWFSLKEFERSATANKLGIVNSVPFELKGQAAYTLARLDEIRAGYGKPIVITSGYRCPALNKAVGGKPNSQHTKAQAADLKWDEDLLRYIIEQCRYDQLIEERSKRSRWIHISFKQHGERQQYIKLNV